MTGSHTQEDYLESRIQLSKLETTLIPGDQWNPFPKWQNREAWSKVPAHLATPVHEAAEALLTWEWPHFPATTFLQYSRIGNRINYEDIHFGRRRNLINLILGECLEGQKRYLDQIINGLWAICEESFWGVPAHNRPRFFTGSGLPDVDDHYVDLFAAETGNLISWAHYLLAEVLSEELPVLVSRMANEVQRRILQPYRERDDFVWLGFENRDHHPNNWNPWIHSNVLAANLLIETDATVRAETTARTVLGVDRFLGGYAPDGGCDEGISYWGRAGATLFDYLELLYSASDGAIDVYGESLIQEIGRYAYRMHIGDQWFVNFADGTAKVELDAGLVWRYGKRINDTHMIALGIEAQPWGNVLPPRIATISRGLADLHDPAPQSLENAASQSVVRDVWLPGIEVLAAHQHNESVDGLFLAAKGGNNAESHNHNDIGSFIVGLDGRPVIIDVGVETYTRKTFSAQRYEIWTMQSGHHNLPIINGTDQLPGAEWHATDVICEISDTASSLQQNLANAWPAEAGLVRWNRTARLDRTGDGSVVVIDDFELESETSDLIWNLMLAQKPESISEGSFVAVHEGRKIRVTIDGAELSFSEERIPVTDGRLMPVWGNEVYRVQLSVNQPVQKGILTITFTRA